MQYTTIRKSIIKISFILFLAITGLLVGAGFAKTFTLKLRFTSKVIVAPNILHSSLTSGNANRERIS
jgi:uncharacterized transporter YbjL